MAGRDPHLAGMTRYSLLDLVPVVQGGTVAQALENAADLAAYAEAQGYHRYWTAEHHGMTGIASAATAVVLAHIGQATRTIRIGAGARPQMWILGSSLYGAQLAAALGLPYAFASHFAPDALDDALAVYRRDFRPSAVLDKPYAMAGFNVFAADSEEEAELIASSQQQAFVALRTGQPGKLPPPVPGYRQSLGVQGAAILDHVLSCSAVGTPATVERQLAAFVERTQVDEVMIVSSIFDHAARKRSIAIAAEAMRGVETVAA